MHASTVPSIITSSGPGVPYAAVQGGIMQTASVHRSMDCNRMGTGNAYRDGLVNSMFIESLKEPLTTL